jgi:hypothetical protein
LRAEDTTTIFSTLTFLEWLKNLRLSKILLRPPSAVITSVSPAYKEIRWRKEPREKEGDYTNERARGRRKRHEPEMGQERREKVGRGRK